MRKKSEYETKGAAVAKERYRLALDLGTNSLGWCAYRLDETDEPCGILRMGVRIFSDGRSPKNLASLAQDRRLARQTRRRRDRVLKRRQRILTALSRFGLLPSDLAQRRKLAELDPYELRARALDAPLTPHEVGRALYHLTRKRGFKSSRKDRGDPEKEKETGQVKEAIRLLREKVHSTGCRTVGEYLAREHAERRSVRARRRSDGQYVLYLQRDMVQEEFEAIWLAQSPHHPDLMTKEAHDCLLDALLFQRPLKPVQPGRCLFEDGEPRARLSSPLQQRFRILQELNNLRLISPTEERALTCVERNLLATALRDNEELTFAQMRKLLGLPRGSLARFNLESEKRKKLKGDVVSAQFAAPEALGNAWHDWPAERQETLAELVAVADDDKKLVEALVAEPWGFSDAVARRITRCRLPDDFGSLSLKALRRIVPELERDVVPYSTAVLRAGYDSHSDFYTGEVFMQLPYYGELLRGYTTPAERAKDTDEARHGKVPNPTVHIGLNQARQLVNALIRRYGHPYQIVVEMTREFGSSGVRRREIEREQADNQSRNERFDQELRELGQRPTRVNRLKLALWDELARDAVSGDREALERRCIYSGRQLSKALLFSDEIEIDHVLPFSRSLHDGTGNKILCVRQANRDKGNRTPFEAFGHSPGAYVWDDIVQRAGRLPGRKARLFQTDALDRFLDGRDFLDRQLTDTGYLARAAKRYLSAICPPNQVWVTSGRLTGMLRSKWNLGTLLWDDARKNRNDHRHHALDAAVIGLCSRNLIQRVATAAARAEQRGENRLLEGLDVPWLGFREELQRVLHSIVVSHKPDHGREAQLHNDTNYGWRADPDKTGVPMVGRHVPIDSLTSVASLEGIASAPLKSRLAELIRPLSGAKAVRETLQRFSAETGIRRVLKEERLSVIPIKDRRTGVPYRFVKGDGNFCYDIFGREDGRWNGEIVNNFTANQPDFRHDATKASNGRTLLMRLHGGDMLSLVVRGHRKIMRAARISEGIISLAEHFEANVDGRNRDKTDPFQYVYKSPSALQAAEAQLVGVSVLGYVNPKAEVTSDGRPHRRSRK